VKTAKPHMATLSEAEAEFIVQKNEKLTKGDLLGSM
jgi:hypothetical protein